MISIFSWSDPGQKKFILRAARSSDIEAIRRIARVTWDITYRRSVTPENRTRIIASSYSFSSLQHSIKREGRDNWFRVAEEKKPDGRAGPLVGFAEVTMRPGRPEAELTRIYVLPEWQRHGVGRALVESLISELRAIRPELRPPRLILTVAAHNSNAITFYEQRGFQYSRSFQASLPGQLLDMQEYEIEV